MARQQMSRAEGALLVAVPTLAMAAIVLGTIFDIDLGVLLVVIVAIVALAAAGWGYLTRSRDKRHHR